MVKQISVRLLKELGNIRLNSIYSTSIYSTQLV